MGEGVSAREPSGCQPGRFLAALARRLAPAATRERVLLPLLADYQHEHVRTHGRFARLLVRCRWSAAFFQAFSVETASAVFGHLNRHAWGRTPQEAIATRRLLMHSALAATACTLLLAQSALNGAMLKHLGGVPRGMALLLPSILTVTLPAGILFGATSAARRTPPGRRALLEASALIGLATFALAAWVTPRANASVRQVVYSVLTQTQPDLRVRQLPPGTGR